MAPACPHAVARGDGRYVGTWFAPFSECACCGTSFPYIDSASFGTGGGGHTNTWTPKNRCRECGGGYVEHLLP